MHRLERDSAHSRAGQACFARLLFPSRALPTAQIRSTALPAVQARVPAGEAAEAGGNAFGVKATLMAPSCV